MIKSQVRGVNTIDLIILGMGPSACECPFDAEVWSVNNGYQQVAKLNGHVNKIFLAHRQIKHNGKDMFNWENFNKMTSIGAEIYNTHKVKGLKSKLYPKKRITHKFNSDYFSDTICYMLAYAIDKVTIKKNGIIKLIKPLTIRLYGIDMRETGEYALEKGGIEYWIGYARGLGIEVTNTEFSTICKTITYAPYGDKEFDHRKFVDGSNIIIGLDGRVYGKRESGSFGRSCRMLATGEEETTHNEQAVELLP